MKGGQKSESKSADFENLILLSAVVDLGKVFPVVLLKHAIVPGIESWSLELCITSVEKFLMISCMLPWIDEKLDLCCPCIVSILDQLLLR